MIASLGSRPASSASCPAIRPAESGSALAARSGASLRFRRLRRSSTARTITATTASAMPASSGQLEPLPDAPAKVPVPGRGTSGPDGRSGVALLLLRCRLASRMTPGAASKASAYSMVTSFAHHGTGGRRHSPASASDLSRLRPRRYKTSATTHATRPAPSATPNVAEMTRPPALASAELPRCENAPWARSPVTATASSTATTAVRAAAILSVTCASVRCPGNETLSVSYTRRGAFVESAAVGGRWLSTRWARVTMRITGEPNERSCAHGRDR